MHRPILESYITLGEYFNEEIMTAPKHGLIESDFEHLLTNRSYQNALINSLVQKRLLKKVAENTLNKTNQILEILQLEITKN